MQAEDGIRDLVRSRGLGDVYKRQVHDHADHLAGRGADAPDVDAVEGVAVAVVDGVGAVSYTHLTLPTRDLVEISVVAVSLTKKNTARKHRIY